MKGTVVIIGDIHGQYYDMIHMFEKVIDKKNIGPKCKLLFLGDYVDRGDFSIEVLIYLFCLKINFPNEVVLLRGNHESRAMTEHFTFREEVLIKYDEDSELYDYFMEAFDAMPVSADVNGDYLCMHGGVSPDL
jgi:serine/threonine-protein phosphatase 2B catalytic subunit